MQDGPDPKPVVLDTSFLLNVLIGSDGDEIVDLWNDWMLSGTTCAAPHLVVYELSNALWQLSKRNLLNLSTSLDALDRFYDLRIDLHSPELDHTATFAIAQCYSLGKTYDLYFVSLAARLESTLWTCDQTLFNAVSRSYPNIRVVRGSW